jgi:uncharacterized membrane protein
MAMLTSIGKRIAPWRVLLFFAVLAGASATLIGPLGWSKGISAGFDAAALAFLTSCVSLFGHGPERMRKIAQQDDANRAMLLVISFLLSVVILAAVVAELGQGKLDLVDKLLVAATLVLVWLFANAVYTLHYAHLFYTTNDVGRDRAGLVFPGTEEPLMSDFVYFAYTLGVAVQTADVQITSPHIRKVVTAHCVAGFFFNLGVLALTINVLAGN